LKKLRKQYFEFPIREVKPADADGTASWESKSPPKIYTSSEMVSFLLGLCSIFARKI